MRAFFAFVCGAGILASVVSAQADKRVAFVVGNSAYKNVAELPNPSLDAKAMSSLLRNAGFDVVEGTDLTRDAMTEKLRDFAVRTQDSDVAIFFYAGHGISVNGKNYLIPIDADLKSEMDIKFGAAIDVDVTLEQTMSDAKVKLVFLDACRDNPFAARVRSAARTRSVTVGSGLAEMKSGEGTLIAFATGPGQTALDGSRGGNSPFTRALLNHLATPGIEIQQAMTRVRAQVNEETSRQQLPWGHTNLIGTVYINPAADTGSATPEAVVSAGPGPGAGSDIELEFWRSIKDSSNPEELNAYLMKYPNGQFRAIASARIASLQTQPGPAAATRAALPNGGVGEGDIKTAEATAMTESALNLDADDRRDLQRRLSAIGFKTAPTGKFADETRRAIMRWQTANGYPRSGYLNQLQHQALLVESKAAIAAQPAEKPAEPKAAPRRTTERPIPAGPGGPVPVGPVPGGDAAGAAFMGGIMGGAIGGALRRR